jgi:hypothetical protein
MTLAKSEPRRDDQSPAHEPGVSVNRRAFMNSIVALPIVAALPVATPAMTPDAGDCNLIKLGEQFDEMVARINESAALSDKLYEPIEEAIWAQATWPEDQKDWSRGDANRYWEIKNSVTAEIGTDWEAAATQHEKAYDLCDDLTQAIWSVPAHSVMDLAVKARTAALANSHLWDKPFKDLDWAPKSTVAFIEATFAAANLPTPAEYICNDSSRHQPVPQVVDPVVDLAERAVIAWNDFAEKCSVMSNAEDLVIDWRKLNPAPKMRAAVVGNDQDYSAFQAGRSSYDPNADLLAAVKEQQSAFKEWKKLERSVKTQTGYTRAERAQKLAGDRFEEVRDELVDARPTSIAGLRAKARAARVSHDDGLQQEIVFDIGVLFGDLDKNKKPRGPNVDATHQANA